MQITVDKKICVVPPRSHSGEIKAKKQRASRTPYPFKNMAKGDSFAVPLDKYSGVTVSASYHNRKFKGTKVFISRKFNELNEVRIWRTK